MGPGGPRGLQNRCGALGASRVGSTPTHSRLSSLRHKVGALPYAQSLYQLRSHKAVGRLLHYGVSRRVMHRREPFPCQLLPKGLRFFPGPPAPAPSAAQFQEGVPNMPQLRGCSPTVLGRPQTGHDQLFQVPTLLPEGAKVEPAEASVRPDRLPEQRFWPWNERHVLLSKACGERLRIDDEVLRAQHGLIKELVSIPDPHGRVPAQMGVQEATDRTRCPDRQVHACLPAAASGAPPAAARRGCGDRGLLPRVFAPAARRASR